MTKICTAVQDASVMEMIRRGVPTKDVMKKLDLTQWQVWNAMRRDRERRGIVQLRRRPSVRRRARKSKK